MKKIKWKILIITGVMCLLPIFLGLFLWEKLPDIIAVHFDINNTPDNFASKGFVVFGLPCIMLLLQVICCIKNDINAYKNGGRKTIQTVIKWIIPAMTIILQIAILGYSLGMNIDMRAVAAIMIGLIFIVMGNYPPKLDVIKGYNCDTEKMKKIDRFTGGASFAMGIIFIVSAFLSPIFTVISLLLLIPYAIICVVYGVIVGKKL